MSTTFRRAVRADVPLLIGLAGASGSGKTYSAMLLAQGMSGERPFAVIDTEAGRAKHYADLFTFDHADIHPPFRPETYLKAIVAADQAGYPAIVVDSMSHEWAGDGGILDWQDEEHQKSNYSEGMRMASWIKPKQGHKAMVSKLLQVRAHVILCFRAEPKISMEKDPQTGKMTVVDKKGPGGFKGWLPICEKNLPYELTASFLFMAEDPGVPIPMKLPAQLAAIFPAGKRITADAGRSLADWARGASAPASGETPGVPSRAVGAAPPPPPEWSTADLGRLLSDRALSMRDLEPLCGPGVLDRATAVHAVTAWLIANPGRTLGDLVDAVVGHHLGEVKPALT